MKLNKNSKVRFVGLSSFFALLALFGLAVFCPTSADSAQAITRNQRLSIDFVLRKALANGEFKIDFFLAQGGGIDYKSIAQAFGIDFVISPKLSLELTDPTPNPVTAVAQPTPSGTFVSNATTFAVDTNSTKGLNVFVYNNANTDKLQGTTTGNVVNATASTVAGTSLASDTWGYNLSAKASVPANVNSLFYKPVSTSSGAADYSTTSEGRTELQLTFGAKISTGTAPDTYSNTVSINTVPNPTTTAYMMDFYTTADRMIEEYYAEHPEEKESTDEQSDAEVDRVEE